MEIFYQEKAFYAGKNIRKNEFAPSEKYSTYAPVWEYAWCKPLILKLIMLDIIWNLYLTLQWAVILMSITANLFHGIMTEANLMHIS